MKSSEDFMRCLYGLGLSLGLLLFSARVLAVVAAFCGLKLPFRISESSEAGAYSLRVHVPK